MAASLFLDLDGRPISDSAVVGYGRSGVVVRQGPLAIKTPLRHPWSSEADVRSNIDVIEREQEVYRRLGSGENQIHGVVPCVELCTNATHLALMENGDLRTYLETNKPTRGAQLAWFRQMARALEQIHGKSVLVADIAARNFLLDSNLNIRICDFSEASILPIETEMESADDNGFSVQTDIGLLGAVMYEVITGRKCEYDLYQADTGDGRAACPPRSSLPDTRGLWLGPILESCWTGGFRNAQRLAEALDSFDLEHTPDKAP
ncbi:serine/threonine-protein kinase HT1 [Aspergillus recurvatus]